MSESILKATKQIYARILNMDDTTFIVKLMKTGNFFSRNSYGLTFDDIVNHMKSNYLSSLQLSSQEMKKIDFGYLWELMSDVLEPNAKRIVKKILAENGSIEDDSKKPIEMPAELLQLKEAFRTAFVKCRRLTVQDTMVAQSEFDRVISLKRSGRFCEANNAYADLCVRKGCISSNVAVAWFKVLCAAGDVKDALTLGNHVIKASLKTTKLIPYAWNTLSDNVGEIKHMVKHNNWDDLSSRLAELGGSYGSIDHEKIDVYIEDHNVTASK